MKIYFVWVVLLLAGGCGVTRTSTPQRALAPQVRTFEVTESYRSDTIGPGQEVDSLAFWSGATGEHWLFATAKKSHRVHIYDATTGQLLDSIGTRGTGALEFGRPNGVAVFEDVLLVVERDNARVQALGLPGFEPLGFIGVGELERPYGLAMRSDGKGEHDLYLTDNPKLDQRGPSRSGVLSRRIKHYRVSLDPDGLEGELVRAFGAPDGFGALLTVESIGVDPVYRRLLVADESDSQRNLKVYTLDGDFTGRVVGDHLFHGEPEGIALYACGDSGVWIVAEQLERRTQFHLFDRSSLTHAGTFVGKWTGGTDGVTLTEASFPGFPAGALFAVHDDVLVTAFDLRGVGRGVSFPAHCESTPTLAGSPARSIHDRSRP